ncbi:ATP-binding protein [Desulfuromonas carbonis]|uniref:ATP-binding protein n=1 Tax=Desulfuromonas sp. DDH964 TaxID=1823759 RepID=UPI00078C8539|nr:ATP-binding protein [Desulfuromonas sp. DDH964]AMV72098.1 sensor histidine kinase, HAMP and PAS domain-containing [Desulfuromonas sp. DDH964]
MKNTLEKRILIFAFLVLTLTISFNTGLNIEGFRRDYRDGILLRCQTLATGLKSSVEKVLGLGIPLNEMEGIGARCQEIVASDPEIFYCLIEDRVGSSLYSSNPALRLSAIGEFLSSINDHTALVLIPGLGEFYDVTLPLMAADGSLAGRIRIGFPSSVLMEHTTKVFQRSILVLAVSFFVVFALVVFYTKRNLIGPIRRLCTVAVEIASGNFRVAVPNMPTRDFAELATALQDMAHSLRDRDEKIRQSYSELEETNLQLQESYEHQEAIGAELGRSREMYRSLLEDASDAILVSDDEDRIVLINKAAEALFAVPRAKTEGKNLFSFFERIQSEEIESHYDLHRQVLQGESLEAELCFVRPSDSRRLVGWARSSPVTGKDGKRMVQTIIRDVTQERETKENLEKSTRELERLNKMKDSFLGVASHELKTPLTVIIGYTELLLGELSGKIDPALLPMLQHISDAAERLSGIVRDMVDVSMLDSQRLRLKRRPTDVNELVRQTVAELEFFIGQRHQHLVLELEEGLPLASCDGPRIFQVITNLVVNAIKFTPDDGTITIQTRTTRKAPSQRGRKLTTAGAGGSEEMLTFVELLVRDTGIGISDKDQVHIFDKFYEVGNIEEHFTGKTAFKGKGTGLGLTIAKGMVDKHGGEIWVESPGYDAQLCPGSVFHVLLPLAEIPAAKEEASSPSETAVLA